MRKTRLHPFFILGFFLLLSACASLPGEKDAQEKAKQASQSNMATTEAIQKAKLKIKKAERENLAFFAPSYYQKALQSFELAKSLYSTNQNQSDVKLNAQLTVEYCNSALNNKKQVLATLKQSLKNKDVLLKLNAHKLFPKQYDEIEKQHIAIIQNIEMGDSKNIKQAEKTLLKRMRALEVKAIDGEYLAKTHTMLQQAEELNAKDLMPNTYQKTLNKITDTQQFIRQNPRQKLRIEELAEASLFQAERLYSLTRYAKQMIIAKEELFEAFILQQEQQFQRINEAFEQPDISNLSFNDQSLTLAKQASQAIEDIHSYQSKSGKVSKAHLDKWKRKTVLLQAEVRRLQKILKKAQASH